jgi:hypothetical protein
MLLKWKDIADQVLDGKSRDDRLAWNWRKEYVWWEGGAREMPDAEYIEAKKKFYRTLHPDTDDIFERIWRAEFDEKKPLTEREKLIRKISALLSKTVERGCTEGEAHLARTHAHKMMQKYGIDMRDILHAVKEAA